MLKVVIAAVATLMLALPLAAQDNPGSEDRAKALFHQLRCVVCQNQSIASSEAGVAQDLRQLVREQIGQGRSDAQIIDYLVDRYGEFVLLKPRFSSHTLILWLSPVFIGLFGLFLMLRLRTSRPRVLAPLGQDEEARLARLLDPGTMRERD